MVVGLFQFIMLIMVAALDGTMMEKGALPFDEKTSHVTPG